MRPRALATPRCDASFGALCRSSSDDVAELASFASSVSDKPCDGRAPAASWFTTFTAFPKHVYDGHIVSKNPPGSREETVILRCNFGEMVSPVQPPTSANANTRLQKPCALQVLPGTLIQWLIGHLPRDGSLSAAKGGLGRCVSHWPRDDPRRVSSSFDADTRLG